MLVTTPGSLKRLHYIRLCKNWHDGRFKYTTFGPNNRVFALTTGFSWLFSENPPSLLLYLRLDGKESGIFTPLLQLVPLVQLYLLPS